MGCVGISHKPQGIFIPVLYKKDLEQARQDQSLKKLTDAQRLNVNNFSKSSMKCLITDLLVHTQNYHNI